MSLAFAFIAALVFHMMQDVEDLFEDILGDIDEKPVLLLTSRSVTAGVVVVVVAVAISALKDDDVVMADDVVETFDDVSSSIFKPKGGCCKVNSGVFLNFNTAALTSGFFSSLTLLQLVAVAQCSCLAKLLSWHPSVVAVAVASVFSVIVSTLSSNVGVVALVNLLTSSVFPVCVSKETDDLLLSTVACCCCSLQLSLAKSLGSSSVLILLATAAAVAAGFAGNFNGNSNFYGPSSPH
ncbi:hypothetical protein FF38_04570 [Lucilia cuprina]|uniref:Uncharacterized protein n=1 Tax=Lucilia cuprina TaxID=7375 RepID=A0A0L0BWF9_LUCCU|nr:hypothetical protein FF38_04570 [Lucilia cuprina]